MTTISHHKLSSSLTGKPSVLTLVVMVAGILFAAPSSAMAQQITATTTPPLTPEEQEQQNRLQNTIAATTRNLAQGQKEVNGVVYTPRWSNPVWVEPDSLSILFVYCLPGEFADSGQDILGGSELEVLESYSLAVTNDLTVWLMVVENEDENVRLPAAVGVICASDLNDAETRVLSPDEQTEINNIIQQFITIRTITTINQVINIINNVTTNGTGLPTNVTTNRTTGPVTPPTNETEGVTPPTPPTNETGGVIPPLLPPTNETEGVTPPTPPTNETGGAEPPPTEEITPPPTEGGAEPPPTEEITPPPTEGGAEPPIIGT
jgi:hypothetical protein